MVTFDLSLYEPGSAALAHVKQMIIRELGYLPKGKIITIDGWPDQPTGEDLPTAEYRAMLVELHREQGKRDAIPTD